VGPAGSRPGSLLVMSIHGPFSARASCGALSAAPESHRKAPASWRTQKKCAG
jgi:hypothetical protein